MAGFHVAFSYLLYKFLCKCFSKKQNTSAFSSFKAALVSWYIWGTGYKKKVIVTPIGYVITTVCCLLSASLNTACFRFQTYEL